MRLLLVFPVDGVGDPKRFTPETEPELARELGLGGGRAELERLALPLHLSREVQFLEQVAEQHTGIAAASTPLRESSAPARSRATRPGRTAQGSNDARSN